MSAKSLPHLNVVTARDGEIPTLCQQVMGSHLRGNDGVGTEHPLLIPLG